MYRVTNLRGSRNQGIRLIEKLQGLEVSLSTRLSMHFGEEVQDSPRRCDSRVLQRLFRLAGVLGIWIRIDERLKRKVRGTKAVLLHVGHCPLEEQFLMLRGTNFGVWPLDTRRHRHA
jgi:hypothetical protein